MASLGVSELNVRIAVAGASVAALLRRLPNFIATGKNQHIDLAPWELCEILQHDVLYIIVALLPAACQVIA